MEWLVATGVTSRVGSPEGVPGLLLSQPVTDRLPAPHHQFPHGCPCPAPSPTSLLHCIPFMLVPTSLPLGHQRRLGSWKMVLWATVLFLSLKWFTSTARKWRLSMLPKIWRGIRLKGLFLTFNFTSVVFHFSSAVLILAYLQRRRDQNWASVLICVVHRL